MDWAWKKDGTGCGSADCILAPLAEPNSLTWAAWICTNVFAGGKQSSPIWVAGLAKWNKGKNPLIQNCPPSISYLLALPIIAHVRIELKVY